MKSTFTNLEIVIKYQLDHASFSAIRAATAHNAEYQHHKYTNAYAVAGQRELLATPRSQLTDEHHSVTNDAVSGNQ